MIQALTRTPLLLVAVAVASIVTQRQTVAQVSGVPQQRDWLINGDAYQAEISLDETQHELTLANGLVARTFRIRPNAATVALQQLVSGKSLIRGVKPEALLTVNGHALQVGGLVGQPNYAYLRPEWLREMRGDPAALQFENYSVSDIQPRLEWKRVRHHSRLVNWPPEGIHLQMNYRMPTDSPLPYVTVTVHYELYDGLPLFSKWLSVHNGSDETLVVDRFCSELLAVVEADSRVEARDGVALPHPDGLHVETDFAFGGFHFENANRHVVHWREDPQYSTQVNYLRKSPCLLQVEPTYGPAQEVSSQATFETFRTFELLFDSSDRERRSLSLRKMYRTIAPWVTENPLMHHMRISDFSAVRSAIDQAAEVGFEMIILSFGSGFDIENEDEDYLQSWKELADYATSKGVEIGGYSLLSSRRIGDGNDIVSPPGQKPTHGNCPALTSQWGQDYFRKLYRFFESTGFRLLEHDGPYPGDVDVTPRPPLQKGEADSRWAQWKITTDFYRWCRANGIYVNAPDYYFLNGTNKCGMGYREVNWSLPRSMQIIHTRQNIFDGTWYKTPSMGWMFVPLTEYHGGGAAATIEPLDEHLDHYRRMMQSNLGLGVQACYRGPRLFDTERTRDMVRDQVTWFKKYRDILESDVIHGRRADGRDLDWMLHVNPRLEQRGMLLVYNPTDQALTREIPVNLYYTGIDEAAEIAERDQAPQRVRLQRDYSVKLQVTVEPGEMNWWLIRQPD